MTKQASNNSGSASPCTAMTLYSKPVVHSINGAWFSRDGTLHPNIIPNMTAWKAEAEQVGFKVRLWTDRNGLHEGLLTTLTELGIEVIDHSQLSRSRFYPYFAYFHRLGMKGDKAAFALASDVLRMAIIEHASLADCCVYADPNDIKFVDLKRHLMKLKHSMRMCRQGFLFPIEMMETEKGLFCFLRNDTLIAHKILNPPFFLAYFSAYFKHLQDVAWRYIKPQNVCEAREFALSISNQIIDSFFEIINSGMLLIRPTFIADRPGSIDFRNSQLFLPSVRVHSAANTWVPRDRGDDEERWVERLGVL